MLWLDLKCISYCLGFTAINGICWHTALYWVIKLTEVKTINMQIHFVLLRKSVSSSATVWSKPWSCGCICVTQQKKLVGTLLFGGIYIYGKVIIILLALSPSNMSGRIWKYSLDLNERLTIHRTHRPYWWKGHSTLNSQCCGSHSHDRTPDNSLKWNLSLPVMHCCFTATGVNSLQKSRAQITALYFLTMSHGPAPSR